MRFFLKETDAPTSQSVSKSFCTKADTETDKHTCTHTESVNKNALALAESQVVAELQVVTDELLLQHAKFAKTLAVPSLHPQEFRRYP